MLMCYFSYNIYNPIEYSLAQYDYEEEFISSDESPQEFITDHSYWIVPGTIEV